MQFHKTYISPLRNVSGANLTILPNSVPVGNFSQNLISFFMLSTPPLKYKPWIVTIFGVTHSGNNYCTPPIQFVLIKQENNKIRGVFWKYELPHFDATKKQMKVTRTGRVQYCRQKTGGTGVARLVLDIYTLLICLKSKIKRIFKLRSTQVREYLKGRV